MTTSFWCWGLDVARARLGIGLVECVSGRFTTQIVEWGSGGSVKKGTGIANELDACHAEVYRRLERIRDNYPPATIAIEIPRGNFHQPELLMITGVVCLAASQRTSMRPWDMNTSTWKKAFLDQGIKLRYKEALLPWVASIGAEMADEDRAAGLAIAGAARQIYFEKPVTDMRFDPTLL